MIRRLTLTFALPACGIGPIFNFYGAYRSSSRPSRHCQATARFFIPNRTNISFGDKFRLYGYRLYVEDESGYNDAVLILYWQATAPIDFDDSVFVHVVDSNGQTVAQKDQSPGASEALSADALASGRYHRRRACPGYTR